MASRTFAYSPLGKMFKQYLIPNNGSIDIRCPLWGATILFGMFQGVGTRFLYVEHSGRTSLNIRNIITGQTESMNYYTFEIKDDTTVTITSTYSVPTFLTAILDLPN